MSQEKHPDWKNSPVPAPLSAGAVTPQPASTGAPQSASAGTPQPASTGAPQGHTPAAGASCDAATYLHDPNAQLAVRHQSRGPIRLVVFDLDGTLLNPQQYVSPRNRQALEALGAAGIGFTLASGRTEQHMRLFAEQLNVTLPVIACNGAVIYDHRKKADVYRKQMSEQLCVDILDHLLAQGMDFMCYTTDGILYPAYSRKIEVMHLYNAKAAKEGSQLIHIEILDRPQVRQAAQRGMVKILALYGNPDEKMRLEELAAAHDATVIASMSAALDIMAPDVSKGTGMAQLARILGISLENVAAFGDHDNDVSMISMAGTGFAMGEATSAAKAVADIIAPNCAEDGVAIAIEQFILPGAGSR